MATFTWALDAAMPDACRGAVLTIGNFDGVHLGHQALLAEAAGQARAAGWPSIAVTFDPSPVQLLRPEQAGPYLSTVPERIALLQQRVDHVLVLRTSHALLELSAREFFDQIIVGKLGARALVEGFNFGFGKGRQGTPRMLAELCEQAGIRFTLVPPCDVLGQPVSSSRVRGELLAGRVDVVTQLLGRPYRITGIVGTGQKRGVKLGFPTANLHQVETLLPGDGVYAAHALVAGKTWPAAVNIGPNPTFGESARKIEAHLIGFAGDIYGKTLSLDFVQKIRATRPFAGVQELVAQINADIEAVNRIA